MGEIINLPTCAEALQRAWAEMTDPDGDAFRASVLIDIARELREGTPVKAPGPEAAEVNARRVVELETELGKLRAKLRSRDRNDDVRRNEGSLTVLPAQVAAAVRDSETKLWSATAEPGERFPAPDQTAQMPRDFFVSPVVGERPQIPVPAQRPLSADVTATIKAQLAQPALFLPLQPGDEQGECVFCGNGIYAATVHRKHDGAALKSWRHRVNGMVICPPTEGDELGETHYATPA